MAMINIILGAYAAWRSVDLRAAGRSRWSWVTMGLASAGLLLSGTYRIMS